MSWKMEGAGIDTKRLEQVLHRTLMYWSITQQKETTNQEAGRIFTVNDESFLTFIKHTSIGDLQSLCDTSNAHNKMQKLTNWYK